MNRTMNEHENIFIHIRKRTFYMWLMWIVLAFFNYCILWSLITSKILTDGPATAPWQALCGLLMLIILDFIACFGSIIWDN